MSQHDARSNQRLFGRALTANSVLEPQRTLIRRCMFSLALSSTCAQRQCSLRIRGTGGSNLCGRH